MKKKKEPHKTRIKKCPRCKRKSLSTTYIRGPGKKRTKREYCPYCGYEKVKHNF